MSGHHRPTLTPYNIFDNLGQGIFISLVQSGHFWLCFTRVSFNRHQTRNLVSAWALSRLGTSFGQSQQENLWYVEFCLGIFNTIWVGASLASLNQDISDYLWLDHLWITFDWRIFSSKSIKTSFVRFQQKHLRLMGEGLEKIILIFQILIFKSEMTQWLVVAQFALRVFWAYKSFIYVDHLTLTHMD